VDPADRKALYEGARLLVQPSHEEGFGIPVLEAMTLGVPVVAANRGALPEVLGDAGLLTDASDPEAIAAAIARVLDEAGLATACASRGVVRSRRFRWAETASRALDVYRLAVRRRAERCGEH
jgi:glycosyltransferase involved in cell wall biosynthesis